VLDAREATVTLVRFDLDFNPTIEGVAMARNALVAESSRALYN
jgi:hypothetical protein